MSLLLEDFPIALRVSIHGEIEPRECDPKLKGVANMTVKLGQLDITAGLSEDVLDQLAEAALEDA